VRSLSRRIGFRLVSLVFVCVVILLVFNPGPGLGVGAPVAHAAPLSACQQFWRVNTASGFWDAQYDVAGITSCNGSAPLGEGWLYPCSATYVTVNMDTWLSQSTARGSARLAESGQTGLETWVDDCQWHQQVVVHGWGQVFTTPLWACLWAYDQTVNLSFNYLCTQDY
jgi:hypothetical protein